MPYSYVMLDRDGVINYDAESYIKSPEEWKPIPGSLEAIALLNNNGYKVVVITNQSGLNKGLYSKKMLEAIHKKMQYLTKKKGGKIEAIYFCPHGPDDDCQCRKPKPKLLQEFAKTINKPLSEIYFIGDKLTDVQAALAVGAKPIIVKTGQGETTLKNNPKLNYPTFDNLSDAAQFIVSKK